MGKINQKLKSIVKWFDSESGLEKYLQAEQNQIDWVRILPFVALHGACLAVIWVGWSWAAVIVAAALYFIRMFAITAFFHRYFSHRAFKAGRIWQFFFAVLGNSAVQRGPLWWASHHRHHHRYADQEEDVHSPSRHGFVWAHIAWLTTRKNFPTRMKYVADWAKYPELRWINRFDNLFPFLLAVSLYALGNLLSQHAPHLGTNGWQMLIWGFFISTVVLFHGTCTINSLDHMIGGRRYSTGDTSRNNPVLALITLGEGWHNNHHHYPISARQGFYWWEIDITYYILVFLSWLGIVRDLRGVPERVKEAHRISPTGAGQMNVPDGAD